MMDQEGGGSRRRAGRYIEFPFVCQPSRQQSRSLPKKIALLAVWYLVVKYKKSVDKQETFASFCRLYTTGFFVELIT
jgi:hypothetical protein